ncbi:VOC family protein [uncultured Bdellovibrio sp.]|uniref:VOC family protein n=1 Tax=Bdellovibrio sp. HCB-162 TaxID=3394234 RepID=UPI0025D8FFFE|nr:VOC family protein [uncultured Bdellovibrio sp.]
MEVNEIHRGRLIDHIQLVVRDLEASKKFYFSIFEALQVPLGGQGEDYFWIDELFISSKESRASAGTLTGRTHLAFQAKDENMVKAFYEAALKAGGKDNGAPGNRPYHPGYYAAFVIDPDGNNIEAVFHGPAKRSADSVKLTW